MMASGDTLMAASDNINAGQDSKHLNPSEVVHVKRLLSNRSRSDT